MKFYLILLFVTMTTCQSIPIVITDGMSNGTKLTHLKGLTCPKDVTFQTAISKQSSELFRFNKSSSEVVLARDIDMKSDGIFQKDFNNDSCTYMVKYSEGQELKVLCGNQDTAQSLSPIILQEKPADTKMCYKNCTKIKSPLELLVYEDATIGETLLNYTLCDDQVHTDIPSGRLEISGNIIEEETKKTTKRLFLKHLVDYESNQTSFTSNITVNGKVLLTINIKVGDSDDQGIEFEKKVYNCNISEGKKPGITNCTVHAVDLDKGINQTIEYRLFSVLPSNTENPFQILNNGSLNLAGVLDREKVNTYYISVKGYQSNNKNKYNFTSIEVNVGDIDDNDPEMQQTYYNVSVRENSPKGTIVCTLSATDKDAGLNAKYEFMMNGTNEFFEVNRTTGHVTVKANIDRENISKTYIEFKVYATALDKSNRTSNYSTVNVTVLDENDNTPRLHSASFFAEIKKTQTINTRVIRMNVSDDDEGMNGKFECSMQPSSEYFKIQNQSKSCDIMLISTLNETQKLHYIFDVSVHDLARGPEGNRSSTKRVTINVTDVNIHDPVFGQFDTSFKIPESTQNGTLLVVLKATDKDPMDKLTFSISSYGDTFGLDNKNRIHLVRELDREKNSSYTISVTVHDGQHSQNTTIDVTVLDVNDNSPIFENSTYIFNIREESNDANSVTVKATDADESKNGQVEYFIEEESEWKNNVSLYEKSGKISIHRIDREKMHGKAYISFFVFAKDKGTPPLTNRTYVIINVEDINDNPPKFQETKVNITIVEETPIEYLTNIYTIQATDKDEDKKNKDIMYHLEGDDNRMVSLNTSTGVLSMLKLPYIKACNNQTFSVQVTAINSANFVAPVSKQYMTITVYIEDINNHAPTFSFGNIPDLQFPLEQPITLIQDFNDADCQDRYKNISFHLAEDSDPRLEIVRLKNNYVGVKYRSTTTDPSLYPTCARSLQVKVYATDGLYQTFNNTSLKLKPNFIIPNPVKSDYTIRVKENTTDTPHYVVHFLDCTDVSLTISVNDSRLSINTTGHNGTIIVDKPFDYEEETLVWANISARNLNDSSKFASVLVKVIIEDVNDEIPKFTKQSYNFTLKETDKIGKIVGYVYATDKDTNSNLTYDCQNDYFNISKDGILTLTKSIDLDKINTLAVINGTIIVNDSLHQSVAVVHINVEFVNEFPPNFGNKSYNFSVRENEEHSWNLTATDKDFGQDGQIANYSLLVPENWTWKPSVSVTNVGMLTVKDIDRDIMGDNNKSVFAIEAIDSGHPPRKGVTYVSITVEGINDNTPEFPDNKKNVSIRLKENPNPYINIFQSKASDADIGIGSQISYRINNSNSTFEINETTGVLSSKNGIFIDNGNQGHLKVKIEAYNKENSSVSNTQTVNIFIEDINNKIPKFTNMPKSINVSECTTVGSNLTRINATDADTTKEYNTVTFWTTEHNDKIHVDSKTGIVYLIGELDVDKSNTELTFNITVYATDDLVNRDKKSNHTVKSNLAIKLQDCNDNVPTFTKEKYVCSVRENSTEPINCSVKAVDMDLQSQPIQYSILNANVEKNIHVNATTGELFIGEPFDYEKNQTVVLNMSATDGKFNSTCLVEINVVNIDDVKPVFKKTPYNFSIDENEYGNFTVVGRVFVEDEDSDYDIQFERNCTDTVNILNKRDIVLKKPLDYENTTRLTCVIKANDTQNDAVAKVIINVLDINDNPPVFLKNCCNAHRVNETTGQNTPVTTVTASDADTGNNSKLTYAIFSGNSKHLFRIDSSTGEIRTVKNLTGFGGMNVSLVIKASDHGKPELSAYTNISIVIVRLNVNAPTFVNVPYKTSIVERQEKQAIFQVYAEDRDHNTLTYTVLNWTEHFSFTNSTLYAQNIDAEKLNKTLFVKVKVTDGEFEDTSTVEVTVIDVNDNDPEVDAASCNTTVNDTTDINHVICTVNATDADVDNNAFTYILYGGKGDFQIHRTSGKITLKNNLGHNGQNYNMSIFVIDSGAPPKYNNKSNIVIKIKDTNPQFNLYPQSFNVSENDLNANVSLKVNSSNFNITYKINSGNKYLILKTFKLNESTGLLSLANKSSSLDFENQNEYNFTILAKDNGVFPKSASVDVVVHVKDVNEPPTINLANKHFFLNENSTKGTYVSRVSVNDPDTKEEFLNFKYSLSDKKNFTIDNNGTIRIKTNNLLENNYEFNVTVIDGGNLSDSKLITVQVPRINVTTCKNKTPENNSASKQICNFAASVNGKDIAYRIDAAPVSGYFKVINGSLLLDTANAFDREQTEMVSLHVIGYYTKYGTTVANITVTLEIEDVNDCSPYFVNSKHNVTIDDVTESGTIIEQLAAIDIDVDEKNRNLTYTIDTPSDMFSIDNFGNLKLTNSTNLQIGTPYYLNITVSDGLHVNNNNATVEILVEDTNNVSPIFDNHTYEFHVTETNNTNMVIGTIMANDQDRGRNGQVTFSIMKLHPRGIFNLTNQGNNSCTVVSTKPMDRETQDTHILILTATDHGTFPRQSSCRITIHVLDVNDNTPVFKGVSAVNGSISEQSVNGTRVKFPQLYVSDKDYGINGSDGLVYTFNDTTVPFCINATNTEKPFVYLCGKIDREKQDIYHLELIVHDANDSGNYSKRTGIPMVIRILDVNDEVPKFSQDSYTFNATENQKYFKNIGNVSVTDQDSGHYFSYNIVSGDDGKFVIDSMNGMLYAIGGIDRETQANFTMNISVTDGKYKAYTTVKVEIIDINDNSPKFGHFWNDSLKEMLVVNVSENIDTGLILNLTASDTDEAENGRVNYTLDVLTSGCESDHFFISPEGGLNLKEALDREICDYYEMNITASDLGEPKLSTSIIVQVKVLDKNDNKPKFCDGGTCNITTAECRTVEKAPVSSVLKVLMVNDTDEGQNAVVSFIFESSPISEYFKIETIGTNIGLVSILKPLRKNNLIHSGVSEVGEDVEVNVTIVATDGGGLNSSLILKISVEPLNDNVPVFDSSFYNFNNSEDVNTGVFVGHCEATTNDTIKKLTYELISGYANDSAPFKIDSKTGNITTARVLDREKIDNYVFAVQVRDGRTPERTAFTAVKVTINDVNDNPPDFRKDNITIHVIENVRTYIERNVSASDKDKGDNAKVSYQLNNNYSGIFNISKTGILTINGTFDYETKTSYTIDITATDEGSPVRMSTLQINILVEDVNDNAPVFNKIKDFYNISESKQPSELFHVNATDNDSAMNGEVIFKMENMDDVPFAINPFNGSVFLQSMLDFETKSNYMLYIVAQDLGSPPKFMMTNVTINVIDIYDDVIAFRKDIYELNISTSTSLHASIINLTVNVPDVTFSLTGDDSKYFLIGNKTGEIVLAKGISSERQLYVFQAMAYDVNGRNASCTVIANVLGHDVTFDTSEIKLSLMENLNMSTILVDLNTTAEFTEEGATYVISDVQPTGKDLFSVNKTTGVLKCVKPLDRETQSQYIVEVSAHTSVLRRKRDTTKSSSTIRVVVKVGDVNDNPPHFPDEQERVFGVPDNVRANYIVGVIKGVDNDISDIGKLRYNITGGRTDVFGISRETGEIKTLVAIASTRQKYFNLSISVSDGDRNHAEATIDVTIRVVPTKNQPILTVDLRVDDVRKMRENYRRNMSDILGIRIQFEKIESHREVDESKGMTRVDLSRTDLIFHGVNITSGLLVSNEEMEKLIKIHNTELSNLFGMKILSPTHVIVDVIADPSAISATQILFICMAVFIFFGSLAALIVAQYTWSRYEIERQEAEKNAERLENDMELSTIRSRQSSKLSSIIAAAAVNPAFTETEFTASSPTQTEQPLQFETQEMHMIFGDEPLEAVLKAQGLAIENVSQSGIDSGVGHTSVHSDGNLLNNSNENVEVESAVISQAEQQVLDIVTNNGEGPVMTSSPRISRETKSTEEQTITQEDPESKVDEKRNTDSEDSEEGATSQATRSPRISRETKLTENQTITTGSSEKENDAKKDTSDQGIEDETVHKTTRSRTASFLLLDATGESETDDTIDDTDDGRKAILKSAGTESVKPKKVVTIQLPAESTSQDQNFRIILTGDTMGDREDGTDGERLVEGGNGDDSDFECTSF